MRVVSIICPVYNERNFIARCMESILSQDYSLDHLELLLVDGMSTDGTREVIRQYAEKYDFIRLLDNECKTVPHALNLGIKASKGDVIIRIDGHCVYPVDYVSSLVRLLFELQADNVGGALNTLPANDLTVCRAIAIASSHLFGVGNSDFKVGVTQITETDTVPFGCFHRSLFERIGLFDEELIRNQDDEFNARIRKHGGKIYLIPSIVIDYTARNTVKKMSDMYYQYGLFKPLVNKKLGSPATVRQFFPPMFLFTLVVGTLLGYFLEMVFAVTLLLFFLYFLIALYVSVQCSVRHRDYRLFFVLPYIFFVIHISYGLGYWVGIYKVLARKGFSADITR